MTIEKKALKLWNTSIPKILAIVGKQSPDDEKDYAVQTRAGLLNFRWYEADKIDRDVSMVSIYARFADVKAAIASPLPSKNHGYNPCLNQSSGKYNWNYQSDHIDVSKMTDIIQFFLHHLEFLIDHPDNEFMPQAIADSRVEDVIAGRRGRIEIWGKDGDELIENITLSQFRKRNHTALGAPCTVGFSCMPEDGVIYLVFKIKPDSLGWHWGVNHRFYIPL